jgi:hypothetical protein
LYSEVQADGKIENFQLAKDPYRVLLIRPMPTDDELFVKLRYAYESFFSIFGCTFEITANEIMNGEGFITSNIKRPNENPEKRENSNNKLKFKGKDFRANSSPYNQFESDTTPINVSGKRKRSESTFVPISNNKSPKLDTKGEELEYLDIQVEDLDENDQEEETINQVSKLSNRMTDDELKATQPPFKLWNKILVNTEKMEFQQIVQNKLKLSKEDVNIKKKEFLQAAYAKYGSRNMDLENARTRLSDDVILRDYIPKPLPLVVLNHMSESQHEQLDTARLELHKVISLFLGEGGLLPYINTQTEKLAKSSSVKKELNEEKEKLTKKELSEKKEKLKKKKLEELKEGAEISVRKNFKTIFENFITTNDTALIEKGTIEQL